MRPREILLVSLGQVLLLAAVGAMVMACSVNLLTVFLGLETMSLSVYVLAGGVRGNVRSAEAGFKYLVLGGFSSAADTDMSSPSSPMIAIGV